MQNYAGKAIKEFPRYVGKLARESPGYLWSHKKELGTGAAAAAALWLYSAITGNGSEELAQLIQAAPSVTGAYLGAASGKTPVDKSIKAVIGGLLGSGVYEGVEHINQIPGLDGVLPGFMEGKFPGQDLIDVPSIGLFSAVPGILLDGLIENLRREKKKS